MMSDTVYILIMEYYFDHADYHEIMGVFRNLDDAVESSPKHLNWYKRIIPETTYRADLPIPRQPDSNGREVVRWIIRGMRVSDSVIEITTD